MLARQSVITNQRDGDRRMSACEQMDARFDKYNTTFHATRVPLFDLEASESTRMRVEESLPNYHEDHIAGWITHCNITIWYTN